MMMNNLMKLSETQLREIRRNNELDIYTHGTVIPALLDDLLEAKRAVADFEQRAYGFYWLLQFGARWLRNRGLELDEVGPDDVFKEMGLHATENLSDPPQPPDPPKLRDELAQLRAERDALQKRTDEREQILVNEVAKAFAERDALKADAAAIAEHSVSLKAQINALKAELSSGLCSMHQNPDPLNCKICNVVQVLRNAGEARVEQMNALKAELRDRNLERDGLLTDLRREMELVKRIWNALGISTYEQAKPLAIDEHVKSLKAQADALASALAIAREFIHLQPVPNGITLARCDAALAAYRQKKDQP